MKSRSFILILCCILFSSCIVKSIQPFYIAEATKFQEFLVGKWNDTKKGEWEVLSFKQMFLEENKDFSKVSDEDKAIYEKYKDGYFITYTKNDEKSTFVTMPFMVNDKLFMDFIPFDYEEISNDLLSQHLLKTHSVAKIDTTNDDTIQITWLDEGRLKDLFKKDQLKLDHEKVGFEESFVLTASSEELYKFLKKYEASNVENKWESSEKFTLVKANAQP